MHAIYVTRDMTVSQVQILYFETYDLQSLDKAISLSFGR